MSVQKLFISLKLNLRKLILILLLVSLVILFSITLIVSNVIHRQQLINNSLATNYEYATKVASISDLYFKNIFNDLSLSANIIKNGFHNEQLLKGMAALAELNNNRVILETQNLATVKAFLNIESGDTVTTIARVEGNTTKNCELLAKIEHEYTQAAKLARIFNLD